MLKNASTPHTNKHVLRKLECGVPVITRNQNCYVTNMCFQRQDQNFYWVDGATTVTFVANKRKNFIMNQHDAPKVH